MTNAADVGVEREPATRPPARWRAPTATIVLAAALSVAGSLPALLLLRDSPQSTLIAAVVAIPILIGLGLVVIFRFEWFVLALLVTRASLDVLQTRPGSSLSGPGVDVASVIGAIFVASSLLWLFVQWQGGRWVRPSTATRALFAFVGASVLSIPLSGFALNSAVVSVKILAGVLMFAVIEQLLGQDPGRAKRILIAAFASFIIPALFGLRQWIAGEGATRITATGAGSNLLEGGSRVKGTFVHPNPFATYLVMVLLVALTLLVVSRRSRRVGLVIITSLSGLLLLVTYTRVGWIAAIIGAAYIGFRHSRVIMIGIAVIVIGALAFVPSVLVRLSDLGGGSGPEIEGVPSNSLSWRLGYWGELLPLTLNSPVTGVGMGTSHLQAAEIRVQDVSESDGGTTLLPHSVFVQVVVETGLLGTIALISVIVAFAATLRQRMRSAQSARDRTLAVAAVAVCLAFLVQMPTENLVTQTTMYWYTAAFATFGLGATARERHPVRP